MDKNRNLFLTIALSVLILSLWQVFYVNPKIEEQRQQQAEQQVQTDGQTAQGDTPAATTGNGQIPQAPGVSANTSTLDRATAVAGSSRIAIDTPVLTGSINLTGARIDDLSLREYHVTVDKSSPLVELLSPAGTENAYFAEFGYAGLEGAPGPDAQWSAPAGAKLTPTTPVTLTFDTGSGISISRKISVDDAYMFSVEDTVSNKGAGAVALQGYGRVTRFFKPKTASIYILHEGLVGVTGEEGLSEYTFSEIEKESSVVPTKSNDGWLGITDKYWATAMVPGGNVPFQPRYSYFSDGQPRYQADFLTDGVTVNPGQSTAITHRLFAGAKKTAIIDGYEESQNIRQFELLIDWGWFHFITKPMFYLLDFLFGLFGNFGVAILATTVIVKAIFFPLANMSYRSMARMKVVQPKMQEIKEKYADDREKQQKAMMELYQKEKINPVAGCWPMLIQIPVFFALYKVIYITIEMRHAPFFGWIRDLSAPDPSHVFNLFGLLPFDPTAVPIIGGLLAIGIWPIIMGVTMFLQMQMNPAPPDPTQQMIFKWMPIVFTFMLATFPAGLVIYWAWNNTLSIFQQGWIMKQNGAEIALWDNLKGMFGGKKSAAK